MHQARLWKPLKDDSVQCQLCSHYCIVKSGDRGLCGVRENIEGSFMTHVYDRIASYNLDPVEKKPLYHFQPGSLTFSFATMGCNMSCSFCQNASLSQPPSTSRIIEGQPVTPQELVDAAVRNKASSISYTYSEPTIFFELMQDTARLAKEHGLRNIMVSNGFMSRECLDELGPLMDAANIDLKTFTDGFYRNNCNARLKPVLENLKHIKELGWWLEVTTLLIPGQNDSPEEIRSIAEFIANDLGVDTPWHISRFHPQHHMRDNIPTSVNALRDARNIGKKAELNHVYVGNVPGIEYANTVCPGCELEVLTRSGFSLSHKWLKDGICTRCGLIIGGVGLP